MIAHNGARAAERRARLRTVNGGPSFYITDNAALSPDAIAALLARIRHN